MKEKKLAELEWGVFIMCFGSPRSIVLCTARTYSEFLLLVGLIVTNVLKLDVGNLPVAAINMMRVAAVAYSESVVNIYIYGKVDFQEPSYSITTLFYSGKKIGRSATKATFISVYFNNNRIGTGCNQKSFYLREFRWTECGYRSWKVRQKRRTLCTLLLLSKVLKHSCALIRWAGIIGQIPLRRFHDEVNLIRTKISRLPLPPLIE